MGGYTGGAIDMWIPDDYTYSDYEADLRLSLPLILALASDDGYCQEIAELLCMNEQISDAFGRMTAYAERNGLTELY